jgi:hypothetical protein
MITQRVFRDINPSQLFKNCAICLERMGITLTKKEVLKAEGKDFDGIIEGTRASSSGKLIIRLKLHGFQDRTHPLFPGIITNELSIETLEVSENNEVSPDTPNANALNEEFNKSINVYVWSGGG